MRARAPQVKNAEAIKTLDAQAQGEALIRKALAELKLWGLQREFALTDTSQQQQQQVRSHPAPPRAPSSSLR